MRRGHKIQPPSFVVGVVGATRRQFKGVSPQSPRAALVSRRPFSIFSKVFRESSRPVRTCPPGPCATPNSARHRSAPPAKPRSALSMVA
jgi:hypothetical protein